MFNKYFYKFQLYKGTVSKTKILVLIVATANIKVEK